jgi:hypothetical protein
MLDLATHLNVPARYIRSIHLLRDFASNSVGVRDYQATPLVLQTAERIMEGLRPDATARAFSLIGPYGAGKSAFGVFMAHYLKSNSVMRQRLVAEHSTDGVPEQPLSDGPMLLPVLVSGNNEPLRRAVLRGLRQTFDMLEPLRDGRLRLPRAVVDAAVDPDLDPQQVADLVEEACALVAERTAFKGLALIIDELGQFLDYAGRGGDERDLFVLQTLAEMAARSRATPCVVLTILHQSFDRYIGTAGVARRTEWAKVQGRFIELPFQEPPVQMLRMVGRALCPNANDPFVRARRDWAAQVAPLSEKLALRPPDLGAEEWRDLIARAYPLHPTVLLALPLLFRQLAQNERSLFAFLTSREPWSVQDFLATAPAPPGELPIYRLPQLYAYIHATLGASLFGRARGQRWAELAEARAQLPQGDGLVADVLTAIGTLGALGQARGLKASASQVTFALCDQLDAPDVERALQELQARKHISYRQHRESFVIWEGSDLDIDELAQAARREIGDRFDLVRLLQQHADTTPLVARRHSYQTGAARVFALRFVPHPPTPSPALGEGEAEAGAPRPGEGEAEAGAPRPGEEVRKLDADGEVLYVVPADDEALAVARAWATHRDRAAETWRVIVLPRRVRELRDLLLDVAALQRVLDTQPELEGDRAARRELSSRLAEAQQALAETIAATYGAGHSQWYWRGREADLRTARQVDELLSQACDATYPDTPKVWNELIVRRQLSSAAAKARRNLIEAMLGHGHEEALGLTGYPPERAIYESVLRTSGIHRQDGDGIWRFGPPPERDPLRLRPVWGAIQQFIDAAEGQARPIVELYQLLEAPPYGVKAGLTPLLFVAAALANAGEVALYEHGNYVTLPDIATFERLLRQPGYFSIRRSRATGARMAVYQRLARALAPRALAQQVQPALLDAVTPLLRLAGALPAYSRKTRRVSQRAQAIRQALLEARAPDELLFEQLPQACGLAPLLFDVSLDDAQIEALFAALRDGLQELQDAYPHLVERVRERIRLAFGATATASAELRAELIEHYAQIAAAASDSQLRALGLRLENAGEGDAWVESVAALVGRKPLDAWGDADLDSFELQIVEIGRRFRVVEQLTPADQTSGPYWSARRVSITDNEGEIWGIVRDSDFTPKMQDLYDTLVATFAKYEPLSTEQKINVIADQLRPLLKKVDVT